MICCGCCKRVSGIYDHITCSWPAGALWSHSDISALCRQMEEDRGDVLSLVESDDEQIFQDAVPRLPPLTNGRHTTLVQIHRIPSSMTLIFMICKWSVKIFCHVKNVPRFFRWPWGCRSCGHKPTAGGRNCTDWRASGSCNILGIGCF